MNLGVMLLLAGVAATTFACVWVLLSQAGGRGGRAHMIQAKQAKGLEALVEEVERRVPFISSARRAAQTSEERAEGLKQMPLLLDVVTLGLSAGLSFDASLELYVNRSDTALAQGFGAALQSWRMGVRTRDEALAHLAEEIDLAALRRFSSVVSQALSFGSPLATVLEQQAQAIRDEQRAEVEERIEQIPVKMLIPLGTLIVPAMLLAILGPLLGSSVAVG